MRLLFPRQRNGFLRSQQISFLIEGDVSFCVRARPVCAAELCLVSNVRRFLSILSNNTKHTQAYCNVLFFPVYLSYSKFNILLHINNQLFFDQRNYKIHSLLCCEVQWVFLGFFYCALLRHKLLPSGSALCHFKKYRILSLECGFSDLSLCTNWSFFKIVDCMYFV